MMMGFHPRRIPKILFNALAICFALAPVAYCVDCNGNLLDDVGDVESQRSEDCNANQIPDECEQSIVQFGRFGAPVSFGISPRHLVTADVDGDGILDFLAASANHRFLVLRRLEDKVTDPSGGFAPPRSYLTNRVIKGIEVGDVDGDGAIDGIVFFEGLVKVYWNDGTGIFASSTDIELPSDRADLEVVDLNGDAADDLVVSLRDLDRILVLISSGNRTFDSPRGFPTGDEPRSVGAGDFDGDGKVDVVTVNWQVHDVTVLSGNGRGQFGEPVHTPISEFALGISVADFNADGRDDLALPSASDVSILLSRETGGFLAAQRFPIASTALEIGDFDLNGDLDIVSRLITSRDLVVLLNDGEGFFAAREIVETGTFVGGFTGADFDGDGDTDLAMLTGEDFNGLVFFWNGGGGGTSDVVPVERVETATLLNHPPHSTSMDDFDGDGDLDFITGDGGTRTLSVYLNDGSGSFVARDNPGSGRYVHALSTADLDDDGDFDMVIGGIDTSLVQIFKNDGAARFSPDKIMNAGAGVVLFSILVDLNGDGSPDIVTANGGSPTISVIASDGDGDFNDAQLLEVGASPRNVAHADFDRDGDEDLAVANWSSQDVSILFNDGAGCFPEKKTLRAHGGPVFVIAGDWNRDGRPDLAIANHDQQSIGIFVNQGSGRFGDVALIFTGYATYSLLTTDFNGDGQPDLIATNEISSNVTALLSDRNGNFVVGASYNAGLGPRYSLAGDIDDDGDVDLIALNRGSFEITYLFNQSGPSGFVDFQERLCTLRDYQAIAVSSPGREGGLGVKMTLPARDDASLLPVLFQDTRLHALHFEFFRTVFRERFPGLTSDAFIALTQRRETRDYYIGSMDLNRTDRGLEYVYSVVTASGPTEFLTLEEARWIYQRISEVFELRPLSYAPDPTGENPLARENAESWLAPGQPDPGFPIFLDRVTVATDYVAYTQGEGFGRVRRMNQAAFDLANATGAFTFQDILVIDHVPRDIEGVVGGVITAAPQGSLSHVAVRTARRGTPNAFVAEALDVFEPWEGQLVRLEVKDDGFTVEAAIAEEAEEFWAVRPRLGELDPIDETYRGLDRLDEMDLSGAARPESRFGGKAVGLARLQTILTGDHDRYRENGFAIPMAYYVDFMRENHIPSQLNGDMVTFEAYLFELFGLPQFETDSRLRWDALASFRTWARDFGQVPPDLVDALADRIEEVFGSREVIVRFRSSSNVEDLLDFNGAGLYESTSVCAPDSFDDDQVGPSFCDAMRANERSIERALAKVWSSLWTFRAHEERAYFQIAQDGVAMGILVSRAFRGEQANGVAFTGDPANPRGGCYLVAVQPGEESVVSADPGVLPEVDMLEVADGQVVGIRRVLSSSLVEAGEHVLTDEKLEELGTLLWHIDEQYPLDTGDHAREDVLLDLEFKLEQDGELAVKQIRPFLVANPGTQAPTFEIDIPSGAVACSNMDLITPSGDPLTEYRAKREVRFRPGTTALPAGHCVFSADLIEEVVVGPLQEVAVPSGPGIFRVDERATNSAGRRIYTFNYRQRFVLPGDRDFELRIFDLEFAADDGAPVEATRVFDEHFMTFELSMVETADDPSMTIHYSSCSFSELPGWNINFELEGDASVRLRERFLPEEDLLLTGPAGIELAEVSLGSQRRSVHSYWNLVYSSSRHNIGVTYWVILDPPIVVPGIERAVAVVELDAPDPPELFDFIDIPQVEAAAYLDENFEVLARPRVLLFGKESFVPGEDPEFLRSDITADAVVNTDDVFRLLLYLFADGDPIDCKKAADVNDDGRVNLGDAISTLLYLFHGQEIPAPFGACGVDPTADALECEVDFRCP